MLGHPSPSFLRHLGFNGTNDHVLNTTEDAVLLRPGQSRLIFEGQNLLIAVDDTTRGGASIIHTSITAAIQGWCGVHVVC